MGNLLVKGNLSGSSNSFADSPYVLEPSYIGGYISKTGGPNGRSKYSGVPLYVGTSNTVDGTSLNGMENYNHEDPIIATDDYISWEKILDVGIVEIGAIQEISAAVSPITV